MSGELPRWTTPPRPGPGIDVVRVKTREGEAFTILSCHWWGVFVHWIGNRSQRCHADRKQCQWCQKSFPRKAKGYLHAIRENTGAEVFLEFTPRSCKSLDSQINGRAHKRGLRIFMSRSSDGNNGRVRVMVMGEAPKQEGLPQERDPEKVLRFLWGEDVDLEHPDY